MHTVWRTDGVNSFLECAISGSHLKDSDSGNELKDSGFHTFKKTGDNIYYLDDDVYRPVSIKIPEGKLVDVVDVNVSFLVGKSIKVKLDIYYHNRDQIKKKIEQLTGFYASCLQLYIDDKYWQNNSTLYDMTGKTKKNDIEKIVIGCIKHPDQIYKREILSRDENSTSVQYKLTNASGHVFTEGDVAYVRFYYYGDEKNIIGEIEKEEHWGENVYYKMKPNTKWEGKEESDIIVDSLSIKMTAPTIEEIEEFKEINKPSS